MGRINITRSIAVVGFVCLLCPAPGHAQSSALLLLRPGPKEQPLELSASALIFDQGHTRETDFDIRLDIVESEGRYRFKPEMPALSPAIGYDLSFININSDHPALPDRLVDISLAGGSAIAQSGEWWFAALAGGGYAGDSPFNDPDGWYGKVDLIVGRNLWDGILVVILDYNGNRAIFPDVPLPGIAYSAKLSPTLSYVVGVPVSSLTWWPIEGLKVDLTYSIPETIDAVVRYEVSETFAVIARFDNRQEAFQIKDLPRDRRLFFEQRRVEVGFRWEATKNVGISAAAGYAFDQEFLTGFDSRNLDSITEISDEPYIRLAVEVRP